MITRTQAVALYGGSVSDLAAALGYTSRHAVYMWKKDEPVPESAYLKLRYQLRPEAFDKNGKLIVAKSKKPRPAPTQPAETAKAA